MKTRFILSVFIAILFSGIVTAVAGPIAGGLTFGASFMAKPQGSMFMSVTPEIWTNYIVENLFKDNEFILSSIDESQYVIGVGVVHIPQAGSPSKVERNRKKLPATITRRKDVDVTYVLDEFTTDPRFIPNIDKSELSYDKMDSCMSEDMMNLKQVVAESMLYNWRPQFFRKTTGTAVESHLGTSNRKAICIEDFIKAKEQFNKWGIPKTDRYCLLDTDMKGQLVQELKLNEKRDYSILYNPVTGDLDKIEGFKIYERQSCLMASNITMTAVPKSGGLYTWTGNIDKCYTPEEIQTIEEEGGSYDNTACAIALFWHKTQTARALGNTLMFDDMGNPQYYGDIYSFLQRAGGRIRRGDGRGVLGVIQDTTT
jgi:hypothetical protein